MIKLATSNKCRSKKIKEERGDRQTESPNQTAAIVGTMKQNICVVSTIFVTRFTNSLQNSISPGRFVYHPLHNIPTHTPTMVLLSYMHTYNIVQKFGNGYFRVKIYLYSYNNSCIKYTKCLIFSSKDFVDEKKYELIRRLVKTYLLRKKIYSRLAYLLYIFYINYSQNILITNMKKIIKS